MSILLIGDSHLKHCYDVAEKADDKSNFGYNNIKVDWHYENDQIKYIEKFYKDTIAKKELPEAVFIMCGGYDLMLTNSILDVVNKLKGFINYLNGMNINHIFVCSVLDRRSNTPQEEDIANKAVRNVNKTLAKAFKNLNKVFFINVRPPGKLKDIIDEDKLHLKPEGYHHVYKRLLTTLEERVFPQIPRASLKEVISEKSLKGSLENDIIKFKKEPGIDKRISDFGEVLVQDYKRVCLTEEELTKKVTKVQSQLETVCIEKKKIIDYYKCLFNVDLSKVKDVD